MSMLLSGLAGANMIYGLGMIDLGMTMDFAQLVVDNEIAKMVRRTLYGIPVCDETLATDIIREVGAGGLFLTEDHTIKHMRSADVQAVTKVFDRQTYAQWSESGKRDLADRALEQARKIIETHKPQELKADVKKKMRDILLATAEEWGVKGNLNLPEM